MSKQINLKINMEYWEKQLSYIYLSKNIKNIKLHIAEYNKQYFNN